MDIAFRTDASSVIGSGHVMRCATLASALRRDGARIVFICRRHQGNMINWLEGQGFAVLGLDDAALPDDGSETIEALGAAGLERVDWMIVDHYQLDRAWEQRLRPYAGRIAVIDDLANREHDCDLLLDQNIVANQDQRYDGLISAGTIALLGPRYALLQPAYAEAHSRARVRRGTPKRIQLYFGASDLPNLTGRVLAALLKRADNYVIDVVVGSLNPHRADLLLLVASDPRVAVHEQQSSLVSLMEQADLAIGASGATSWERLCLSLPALVITLAENQEPIAAELHRRHLVKWLGMSSKLADNELSELLDNALVEDVEQWFDSVQAKAVDGLGAARVAAALLPSGDAALELICRPARAADEALLLAWANDATTRATAFDPRPIAAESHKKWLARRLVELDRFRLFVVEMSTGVEAGQVRFERDDDACWVISYSIARELRGKGIAAPMLELALNQLSSIMGAFTAVGRVLPNNRASRRVFERLRFTWVELDDKSIEFRREL